MAELAVELSAETRFRVMAEASPVPIWATDASGRIAFVNAAWERFFGRSAEEVRSSGWQPMVHPDDAGAYSSAFFHALNTRSSFDARCRARRADGEWRWLRSYAAPHFCPSGEFLGMVGSSPDITEQVDAQCALRESEARFHNMADNAPVTIWMSDAIGRCTFVGKGWQQQTGQTPEAALGGGWLAMVHPDDVHEVRSCFADAVKDRSAYRCDYRLRAPDGAYRVVLSAAAPRLGDAGEFLGYIGSLLDITERKAQENALRRADEQKDEFLAVLSHELRNPLGAIANAAQILRHDPPEPQAASAANVIVRQVAHLKHLVDDLLDIARLANGKIRLRRRPTAVGDAVAAALEACQRYIEVRGHELIVAQPSEPVYVDADPVRLSQVIVNLLANSAKYTRTGGRIELQVHGDAEHVEVRVIDNGVGIPPDMLSRIFDMFSQGQSLSEPGDHGLGIGLALSKGIVDLHGGTIAVHSDGVGKGSRFVVQLPRLRPGAVGETLAEPPHSQRPRTVLVVDDNEDSARTLAVLLRIRGHEAHEAYSGDDALSVARAVQPDVVILDIGMPGMNGLEVARCMRAEPWGKEAVLVALTGYGQDDDKQRSIEAGFDRHMTKPVDIEDLARVFR